MGIETIAIYVVALFVAVLLAKIFFKSIGTVIKILFNAIIGGAIIWLLNILGMGITLNWITAILVGFLGIPGVIVVLILQFVFHII